MTTEREALERCTRLLKRYVSETPLGHQPHMIALEAEEAIAQADAALATPVAEPVATVDADVRRTVEEALTSYAAARAAAPAEPLSGWVLVPVEPTEAMLEAISGHPMLAATKEAYAAMLAAAPKGPVQTGDELSIDAAGKVFLDWQTPAGDTLSISLDRSGAYVFACELSGGRKGSGTGWLHDTAYVVLSAIAATKQDQT